MSDRMLKLIFSGVLAIGGLAGTLTVTLTGIVQGLAPSETLSYAGLFTPVVFAAVAFFLGYTNGNGRPPPAGGAP